MRKNIFLLFILGFGLLLGGCSNSYNFGENYVDSETEEKNYDDLFYNNIDEEYILNENFVPEYIGEFKRSNYFFKEGSGFYNVNLELEYANLNTNEKTILNLLELNKEESLAKRLIDGNYFAWKINSKVYLFGDSSLGWQTSENVAVFMTVNISEDLISKLNTFQEEFPYYDNFHSLIGEDNVNSIEDY